jgi:hypothetical protein
MAALYCGALSRHLLLLDKLRLKLEFARHWCRERRSPRSVARRPESASPGSYGGADFLSTKGSHGQEQPVGYKCTMARRG